LLGLSLKIGKLGRPDDHLDSRRLDKIENKRKKAMKINLGERICIVAN